jgi:hypothetical protein
MKADVESEIVYKLNLQIKINTYWHLRTPSVLQSRCFKLNV